MRGNRLATTLLTVALVVAVVVAFLFVSGRSYLLQKLPGWPRPSPALAGAVARSPSSTYWGAFVPGVDSDPSVMTAFAKSAGRQPAIASMYQQWWGEPAFPAATAHWLSDRGTVPLVVWEPWRPDLTGTALVNQAAYRLSAIAAGAFDDYVRRYAGQVRAYGGPLFLEPMHEMNGTWYPWSGTVNGNSPAEYIAAWRHLHDVFEQVGATNVTWTWTPNGETVPDTAANQPGRYWPGSPYVDWVGVDSYNWGASRTTQWRTVAQMFDANVAALSSFGRPMILAETASVEQGGDKAAWIASLFETLTGRYRDAVAAVIWFDGSSPGHDWRTNTSATAQAAFMAGVAGPGMLSAGQVVLSGGAPR